MDELELEGGHLLQGRLGGAGAVFDSIFDRLFAPPTPWDNYRVAHTRVADGIRRYGDKEIRGYG